MYWASTGKMELSNFVYIILEFNSDFINRRKIFDGSVKSIAFMHPYIHDDKHKWQDL